MFLLWSYLYNIIHDKKLVSWDVQLPHVVVSCKNLDKHDIFKSLLDKALLNYLFFYCEWISMKIYNSIGMAE